MDNSKVRTKDNPYLANKNCELALLLLLDIDAPAISTSVAACDTTCAAVTALLLAAPGKGLLAASACRRGNRSSCCLKVNMLRVQHKLIEVSSSTYMDDSGETMFIELHYLP